MPVSVGTKTIGSGVNMNVSEINELQRWLRDLACVEIKQRFIHALPHERQGRMVPEWHIEAEKDGVHKATVGLFIFQAVKNLRLIFEGKAEDVILSGGYYGGRTIVIPIDIYNRGRIELPIPHKLSAMAPDNKPLGSTEFKTVTYVENGGLWCARE